MANFVSQVKLPNNTTYTIRDPNARPLSNNDFDTINVTELNAGDLIVTGVGRFTNGVYGNLNGTATQVSNNLKIQLNSGTTEGTNQFTYNGSSAKTVNITKSGIGLGNVENKSSATIRGELTSSNVTTALGYTPLNSNLKGASNGLAELDANGLVPSSQLPSYVDDVLEYSSKSAFPTTGETGKIYVATDTNLTYRWSGSAYTEISPSLALGETSSTAYRGDRGATAYSHATDSSRLTTATASGLYKVASTAQGHIASLTAVTKADITGLGIPGSDTNTHRPIQMNGTEILGNNTTALNLKAGTNVSLSNSSGTVTIASTDTNTTYSLSASGESVVLSGSDNSTSTADLSTAFSAYLPLAGGQMTGTIITPKNDSMGIRPNASNWGEVGDANYYFYKAYVTNYYGTTSYITNWARNNNIGTPASSSAAANTGLVNFYNTCAAGGTQTKTTLVVDSTTTSNITLYMPNKSGTLALTSDYVAKAGDTMTGKLIVPKTRIANTCYGVSFGRTTNTPVETIIKTGIKWVSSSHMPVVHLTGYAYGLSSPVELKIGFYIYSGKVCNTGVVNMGSWEPDVYLYKYTRDSVDYVAVGLAGSCYFLQLQADVQDEMGKFASIVMDDANWSWDFYTDIGHIPAPDDGTTCLQVPYKANILNGIRNVSINGNYLRVNNNGTNTDLTIPYATSATSATKATQDGSGDVITSTYLKLSGGTLTGDLLFSNSGTNIRQIKGTNGDSDAWRIAAGATGTNAGWLEIATADDYNEPIYVRQYMYADSSTPFGTVKNEVTLLDASGNTTFPKNVTATKFIGALQGNADTATSATTASKLGSSNVGSATQPIYLASGTATACTYTLGKSVPRDAVFTDTKNTAGSTDTSSKIFLIGATSQAANPQTYSQDTAYVDTDGCVYSGGNKVEVVSNNAGYHNSIYRGKSLGTSITTAQWNAISAGTFDDMYIGDYWTLSTTIGGTTSDIQYVIAGFDYWWNCGNTVPDYTHHIVLVPATILYKAKMDTTNITTGGYLGSAMYTTNLANARTGISTLFGDHLYSVIRQFTNSVNTAGQADGQEWVTSTVDLMSETMVFGHPVWALSGYEIGVDRTILPLFALEPAYASIRSTYWLRSAATPSRFSNVSAYGYAWAVGANTTVGVRPAFGIC